MTTFIRGKEMMRFGKKSPYGVQKSAVVVMKALSNKITKICLASSSSVRIELFYSRSRGGGRGRPRAPRPPRQKESSIKNYKK